MCFRFIMQASRGEECYIIENYLNKKDIFGFLECNLQCFKGIMNIIIL
jgi:hypothetical protein